MIAYTTSILPFFLSKGTSFYSVVHPTAHDSGEVSLIPSSRNGQDPFIAIVAMPCLWHVAHPRNQNVCWEAPGKGFLPLEKRSKRKKCPQGFLWTQGSGPLQPACCQSEYKIKTLWKQIHIGELQGYCHTTPGLQTISELLMWDNKCPYLSQFEAVWDGFSVKCKIILVDTCEKWAYMSPWVLKLCVSRAYIFSFGQKIRAMKSLS